MKLTVNLVTWNGAEYVPYLFDSLRKQTFKDWQLLVVDNNSQDGMVELMRKELADFPVQYEIVQNKTNLGFAGGHNMAFKTGSSEYVLMLNQDMYLMPDCLEKVVTFLDNNVEAAAVSPRLMKWNFLFVNNTNRQVLAINSLEKSFTDQVDTLGLKVFRSRRVVEQYTAQQWAELSPRLSSYDAKLQVFGISGALPTFRRSALKELAFPSGAIFDESYHAYKEDVDLAYRLAAFGGKVYVLLDAVAYHDRSAAGPKETSDKAASKNKKTQSEWVKYHSYKNHLMTLYKNEYWQNLILDFPWILWYELKKFIYFLLLDRTVLAGLREIWTLRKELKEKRVFIKETRKLSWKGMRKLWQL